MHLCSRHARRSIVDFANEFKARNLPLHTLVNNAGVFLVPFDHTQEGFETTVGINYFGGFLLTHLLMDKLKETGPGARRVETCTRLQKMGNTHI